VCGKIIDNIEPTAGFASGTKNPPIVNRLAESTIAAGSVRTHARPIFLTVDI
jgi:hypothetical protein